METKTLTETREAMDAHVKWEKLAESIRTSRWLRITKFIVCYLVGVAIPIIGSELLLRIMAG